MMNNSRALVLKKKSSCKREILPNQEKPFCAATRAMHKKKPRQSCPLETSTTGDSGSPT
jgi:hypothetical protein